jgi:hypothetical protein
MPTIFDDIAATIDNEQERKTILEELGKRPETKKLLENLYQDGTNYRTWYAQNWPDIKRQMEVDLPEAKKTIEKLQEELKMAKSSTTPANQPEGEKIEDMTYVQVRDKVLQDLKGQGFLTKAEAEALASQKALEAEARLKTALYSNGLPQVEQMLSLGNRYKAEFGKDWDRRKFDEFVAKGGFRTLSEAYDAFTRDDLIAKIKAEAFEQGKTQGTKETAEKLGKEHAESARRALPVDMGGSQHLGSTAGIAPPPADFEGIGDDYMLGKKGGFKLAREVAKQFAKDEAAGKVPA